ncbi:MAG: hypothetical protein ABIL44_01010 [candidate division WOR-3 bacterium]
MKNNYLVKILVSGCSDVSEVENWIKKFLADEDFLIKIKKLSRKETEEIIKRSGNESEGNH